MNENTFRAESLIRASDSAHGHEKHEVLLRTVLSCPLSCTDAVEKRTLRKLVGSAIIANSAVIGVELRLRRIAPKFRPCDKWLNYTRNSRMDGSRYAGWLIGDPNVIPAHPFGRTTAQVCP